MLITGGNGEISFCNKSLYRYPTEQSTAGLERQNLQLTAEHVNPEPFATST